MIEITQKTTERAMLVALDTREYSKEVVEEHLAELEELANTAGAETVFKIIQTKTKMDSAYYIGKGKAEELAQLVDLNDINIVIFDDDLSPVQVRNLENLFKRKVIDRSGLILDIFASRAKTKEAKTQVELAQLQYILPRLTRMWTHLERQMGGIGTRAGAGETQIEVDRRMIGQRIAKLKKELVKIEKERSIQSQRRKEKFRVALVGYTNAGKSTLMNAITGANVYIRDQLFATLDTTIRSNKIDDEHEILLSDTVGFIRKLPHHLVASFRSTLQEVLDADIILIVLDASSQQIVEHFETINSVLNELGGEDKLKLIALNKIDRINEDGRIGFLKSTYPDGIFISAKEKLRIDALLNAIKDLIDKDYMTAQVRFNFEQAKEIADAQNGVTVLESEYTETGVQFKLRGSKKRINQILNSSNLI